MQFSIFSYNLLYHQAVEEVLSIIKELKPDVICLQEVAVDEIPKNAFLQYGYKLASTTNSFIKREKIYGLATFYHQNILKMISFENSKIPHTFYDWLRFFSNMLKRKFVRRTILKTTFRLRNSKEKITIFNIHLTAEATNEARLKQLNEILKQTTNIKNPLILVGDFNYAPYRRKKLEKTLKKFGFKEATDKIDYTFSFLKNTRFYGWFVKLIIKFLSRFSARYKLDYVFYKKIKLVRIERIASKISDHYPIFAVFKI